MRQKTRGVRCVRHPAAEVDKRGHSMEILRNNAGIFRQVRPTAAYSGAERTRRFRKIRGGFVTCVREQSKLALHHGSGGAREEIDRFFVGYRGPLPARPPEMV